MFALITQLTVQTVLLQVAALYTPPHVLLDSWWSPGHFAQILPNDTGVHRSPDSQKQMSK